MIANSAYVGYRHRVRLITGYASNCSMCGNGADSPVDSTEVEACADREYYCNRLRGTFSRCVPDCYSTQYCLCEQQYRFNIAFAFFLDDVPGELDEAVWYSHVLIALAWDFVVF